MENHIEGGNLVQPSPSRVKSAQSKSKSEWIRQNLSPNESSPIAVVLNFDFKKKLNGPGLQFWTRLLDGLDLDLWPLNLRPDGPNYVLFL